MLVTMKSRGNPDYNQDPTRSLCGVPKSVAVVLSLEEASKTCLDYIEEYELGAGNWAGGEVTQGGQLLARISFNGRIWLPDGTEYKE